MIDAEKIKSEMTEYLKAEVEKHADLLTERSQISEAITKLHGVVEMI